MVPSSAAIADPTRPASIVAASTGPSSRTIEILITEPSRVARPIICKLMISLNGQHHADERARDRHDRDALDADRIEDRHQTPTSATAGARSRPRSGPRNRRRRRLRRRVEDVLTQTMYRRRAVFSAASADSRCPVSSHRRDHSFMNDGKGRWGPHMTAQVIVDFIVEIDKVTPGTAPRPSFALGATRRYFTGRHDRSTSFWTLSNASASPTGPNRLRINSYLCRMKVLDHLPILRSVRVIKIIVNRHGGTAPIRKFP